MTSTGHLEAPGGAVGEGPAGSVTYLEAIRAALVDAMREDDRVFLMGEDIGAFGGAFGVTAGLLDEFGEERVRDTPISEEGFVGAAIGAAWMGERPVVELQFADFITCPFDPIVTVAAKTHWRSGQAIPIVIRCPTGGGVRGGPFHAGSPEGWFVGTAGLKVVCPGTVEDAYGLLRAAIEDPDPVLYFEHKRLYRTLRGPAPLPSHRTPIGPAHVVREGSDATVVTYGSGVTTAHRRGRERRRGRRGPRPAHRVAARRGGRAGIAREDVARARAAGGGALDRCGGARALPDRPAGLRAARRPAGAACAARHARALRARARGRLHAVRRVHRGGARRPARLLTGEEEPLPIEPCVDAVAVGREDRRELFRLVLLQRLFEERELVLYRQGRLPGSVYTGRGQEAVAAGAGLALGPDDVVAPLNRELACHFARGATPADAFRNFMGKGTGPTRGRDGNMHFGAPARGVFPLVSMLGDLVPVVVGAALAFKRRGEPRVALTFLGEGAFSVGDTHEGLNLAGVWQVPVVFVVQSNRYSYSTPVSRQMVNTNIAQRIYGGWSIPAERIDGTDAIAVLDAVRAAVERARRGNGPQALEALSVRMHGHAGHDDARYVPAGMREEFEARFDPVERLAARLRLDGLPEEEVDGLRADAAAEIAAGLAEAEQAPAADPATLEDGVYAAPPWALTRGCLPNVQGDTRGHGSSPSLRRPAGEQVEQARRARQEASRAAIRRCR